MVESICEGCRGRARMDPAFLRASIVIFQRGPSPLQDSHGPPILAAGERWFLPLS